MVDVKDLSKRERFALYKQGYTNADIQRFLNDQEQREMMAQHEQVLAEQQGQIDALRSEQSFNTASQIRQDPRQVASMFAYQDSENLIKWQLELDSILERIEHMLRGDKITFIQGNMQWSKTDDVKEKILNDFGVAEVMRILSMYLNRNTILSNYDEETINWKVLDFGYEISDLFFLKYEAMGLDTLEKRKLYPILVRQLVDVVHSAYLRALHGGERESLREARHITQSDQMNPQGVVVNNMGQPRQERGIFNPMRYVMGKYK